MSKTDEERKELLASLGLGSEPKLAPTSKREPVLAATDQDPHTMPVTDIVFDVRLLEAFPSLEGEGMAAASRHVFALYKTPGRDRDRNSLLHRRIGQFIAEVRRSRDSGGHVREAVKTTREQRDLANLLASKGLTVADLATLLAGIESIPTEES